MSHTDHGPKAPSIGREPAPQPQAKPGSGGISAEDLESRIDRFLSGRGLAAAPPKTAPVATAMPADFVCEDDVRQAIRAGRKVLVGEKTILTPSARDLGESEQVFVYTV